MTGHLVHLASLKKMENNYDTLSEAITSLRREGYTEDFNLQPDCLHCSQANVRLFGSDFKVDKFYRFEGPSDPADASILYAISSDQYDLKGILVNGYGIYTQDVTDEM